MCSNNWELELFHNCKFELETWSNCKRGGGYNFFFLKFGGCPCNKITRVDMTWTFSRFLNTRGAPGLVEREPAHPHTLNMIHNSGKGIQFKGHFTHETESPWPFPFKHSHWWKRRSRSKFTSHYAWGTNGVFLWMQDGCKVYMDSFRHGIIGACFTITWTFCKNHFSKVSPTQKPGDNGIPNAHNRGLVLYYHVWGPVWIGIHWNSIWLRARSHMTSHYTWRLVTTLHGFGGALGRPLDTFFWALTIPWSRLLARVKWPPVALTRARKQSTRARGTHFPQNSLFTFATIWEPTSLINIKVEHQVYTTKLPSFSKRTLSTWFKPHH